MNSLVQFNASQFNAGLIYAWPEIYLGLAACAILMLDLLLNDAQRRWTGVLAMISLIIRSVPSFSVWKNVTTTTNEIDILVKVGLTIQVSPVIRQWGSHFLCECKLVNKGVNATWIGKLNSVLELHGSEVGVLVSSKGAPKGRAKTQIHMHAFKTPPRVMVCISLDELKECENGKNFLRLISTRYVEAKSGAAALIVQ